MARPRDLLDVTTIYHEPAVPDFSRGREILDRFPEAERIVVPSHWNIPSLHGNAGSVEDWVRIKRSTLVLGVKKGLAMRPNGRSAHFIAPSTSNGCAMACAYCYVPRRKGFANPISVFVNVEAIAAAIVRHASRQGPLGTPDTIDPALWVYDLGENGDLSVDAMVSDTVRDLVALFRDIPNAKASFATKAVNRDLLAYDPQGKTRIRFSLMPERIARIVDVRTAPIPERIAAIDDFVAAGYEVHLNFSPVILYPGWEADWCALFDAVDGAIGPAARAQLKAEIILLTHNADLHAVNLGWHPKAEDLLWRPDIQEAKVSEGGGANLRYRTGWKGKWLARFKTLLAERMPYCTVRYAF
ncbi:spore photoproduct lyase family protein [Methylobacterium sp.]|uniref:spore photoproduct lyase family protein n=1 Tax=Methylobacterium sp. TaxID=409 RepID=UPI0025F9AA63|nr:spore photoproduct lyase family protein [Methylobacterium sp.]MBY0257708.1 spore photoproduct lyase family protein [Methylobacterium sp.]